MPVIPSIRPLALVLAGLSVCGVSGYLLYLFLKKDEEDDYLNPLIKAKKFKVLEIRIPNDFVKILIGRSGKNVSEIETQSNVTISFKESNDEEEKICVIKGSKKACKIAENLVVSLLQNQPMLECEDLWLPSNCLVRFMGRDGEHVREVANLSGAKITIDTKGNGSPRRCTVKGTKEQILVAKSLIEEYQIHQANLESTLAKREPRLPAKSASNSPKCERMPPTSGQPDSLFEVYVSAMIDPSRFWLQIVGPKATELDVLVEEMSEYYRKQENRDNHVLESVAKGDLVAAVFKYDNKWYRAEVLNLNDDGKTAELYFVDYGDIDFSDVHELYELRTDFLRLHFQAIECFLAKVEPVGDGWSVEAVDKFEEWSHVGQWKKLSAKMNGYSVREKTRAKREGSPVPGVDLFDVNNDQDVDIAQELVNYGYAVFKKDFQLLHSSSRATSTSNVSLASSST